MVPTLADVATSIHHAVGPDPVAQVVYVHDDAEAVDLTIGLWDVPDLPTHPIEPLIGFRAPPTWDAVGIVSTAQVRSLVPDGPAPGPTVTTVLLQRDGTIASVVGSPGRALQHLGDPPVGLVPDVLARVLGRPTPAPEVEVDAYLDLAWLDRIACGLLDRPSRARSWRWLADRHPLRGGGPPPAPEVLAARVAEVAEAHPWSWMRQRVTTDLPATWCGPPGGTTPPAAEWFDDGSLCRWRMRCLPPADVLVPDLLSVLPSHLGEQLLTALGS